MKDNWSVHFLYFLWLEPNPAGTGWEVSYIYTSIHYIHNMTHHQFIQVLTRSHSSQSRNYFYWFSFPMLLPPCEALVIGFQQTFAAAVTDVMKWGCAVWDSCSCGQNDVVCMATKVFTSACSFIDTEGNSMVQCPELLSLCGLPT